MAATGQIMILFVILHVAGNSTIYFNRDLNTYAAGLHAIPVLLWAIRIVLFAAVLVHIFFAVQLTLENSEARPQSYRKKKNLTSTFAGRNMVWTGSVIGTFVVYHLLHFTFQVIDTGSAAAAHPDALGRPDVFSMVVAAFRHGTMGSKAPSRPGV
jgi:succinate dehydrogenase / fumarate reductase cytochrome b subunit